MNKRSFKNNMINVFTWLVWVIGAVILCFVIATVMTKYQNGRRKKNVVKQVEYQKAEIEQDKIKMVKKLNKLEKKAERHPENEKLQAKIKRILKQIENIGLILSNTMKKEEELKATPIELTESETKITNKLNDIKENVL